MEFLCQLCGTDRGSVTRTSDIVRTAPAWKYWPALPPKEYEVLIVVGWWIHEECANGHVIDRYEKKGRVDGHKEETAQSQRL